MRGLLLWFLCAVSVMPLAGCGGTSRVLPTTIAFASGQMAPPMSVMATTTATLSAIVTNDPRNLGVSWLLTCASQTVAQCGSITRHTASGSPTTYIAPLSAPPGGTVTIEANSSASPSQSVTATIAITPIVYGSISVAFSPPLPASLPVGGATSISVVVTNDHLDANGKPMGVTLALTCANAGTCGTLVGFNYIAPTAVPPGGTVTITATSVADPTKSASAVIMITPPVVVISLVGTPATSISAGAAVDFGAKVTDGTASNPAGGMGVDWSVTCGGTACGFFVPQHTANDVGGVTMQKVTSYAAPSVVPPEGMVRITATATADPTKKATVTLAVNPANLNNGLLNGQYAFFASGAHVDGLSAVAGSLIADGNGRITAAEEVVPGQAAPISGIAGSYFIGSDGRGLITLVGLPGFSSYWLNGQQVFAVTVIDSRHALIEEFDGSGPYNIAFSPVTDAWYGRTVRGELELQQTNEFSVPPSGPYAFAWAQAGPVFSLAPCSGFFVCAAHYGGVLNADSLGNLTSFYADRYIDGSTGSIASGAYGPQSFSALDSFGLGTLNLGPYSFNYFLVDSGHMIVVAVSSSDLSGLPAGHIFAQSSSAPSFTETFMFTLAGSTPTNSANGANIVGSVPQAAGGWFNSDSSGNVNGYLDTNSNGQLLSAPVTGTLAASAVGGRWTLTLRGGGAAQFAIYPTIAHGLLMFELDNRKSGTGAAFAQASQSPAFQGTYAAGIQQLGLLNVARNANVVGLPLGAWGDISGQLVASNSSNITGTLDIDQVNGAILGPSGNFWTQSPGTSVTGSFTAGAQGRATGSIVISPLVTVELVFYVVDTSTVIVLEEDTSPAVGIFQRQNF